MAPEAAWVTEGAEGQSPALFPPLLHPGSTQGKRRGWEPTGAAGAQPHAAVFAGPPPLQQATQTSAGSRQLSRGAPQDPPPTSALRAGALARSRESESTRPPESTRVTDPPCCLGWILGSQLQPGLFCISTNKVTKALGPFQRTTCPKESHSEARDEVVT